MRLNCNREPPRFALRPAMRPALALLVMSSGLLLVGCRVMGSASEDVSTELARSQPTETASGTALAPGNAASPAALPPPGAGVLSGRLVDGITGLPVPDAGVSLLGQRRRTISVPDGSFRFDAVPSGTSTLVFGPIDGYVPRSVTVRIPEEGLDIGITPLLPVAPPTLITADYGGTVQGCGATQLTIPSTAISESLPVSLTCIEQLNEFPAEPPAGRLPLAVVHIAPEHAGSVGQAQLTVDCPRQPQYAADVELDLLRLDLDRLVWTPTGTLTVSRDGRSASGPIAAFGSYMVCAPAFGALISAGGDEPTVTQFSITAIPDGPPVDVFPRGTPVVYATFDFARMANTPVMLRTADMQGNLVFELNRPYTNEGRENIPMSVPEGSWQSGKYVTTIYLGDPPAPRGSIQWQVASRATPTSAPPTLPPVLTSVPVVEPPAVLPPPPTAEACRVRTWWFAYMVRQGDTLYGLAQRTGTSLGILMQANCLTSTRIVIGQVLYVPRPPDRSRPPATTAYPPRPTIPGRPTQLPLTTPTTWYTPRATLPPANTATSGPAPSGVPPQATPSIPSAPSAVPSPIASPTQEPKAPTAGPPPTAAVPSSPPPTNPPAATNAPPTEPIATPTFVMPTEPLP